MLGANVAGDIMLRLLRQIELGVITAPTFRTFSIFAKRRVRSAARGFRALVTNQRRDRQAIGASVVVAHVLLFYLVIYAFNVPGMSLRPEAVVDLSIGSDQKSDQSRARHVPPEPAQVQPDPVVLPVLADAQQFSNPSDSPGGIVPARPIDGAHNFPILPSKHMRSGDRSVELMLSIDDNGQVTDAIVTISSGVTELDKVAIAWVKAHWRYYPALVAGQAIVSNAVLASVRFRSA